jgi:rhodanese-related sulfurtransferase/TusA-related sulfurtransferase
VAQADQSRHFFLDVRTPAEYATGSIPGAVNIPLAELRDRIADIPRDKTVLVFCRVGLIAYNSARVLHAHGFTNHYNLSGGYETWHVATMPQASVGKVFHPPATEPGKVIDMQPARESLAKVVEVNACGLQCPGPVMRLKQEMDLIEPGEAISIKASDPGFFADAPSWARATGNVMREISVQKGIVTAVIEKSGAAAPATALSKGDDKTIIIFSGDLD